MVDQPHHRRAHEGEARVLAKLEMQNPGGSVKDRIAKDMIEKAEARGEISPGKTTIVEVARRQHRHRPRDGVRRQGLQVRHHHAQHRHTHTRALPHLPQVRRARPPHRRRAGRADVRQHEFAFRRTCSRPIRTTGARRSLPTPTIPRRTPTAAPPTRSGSRRAATSTSSSRAPARAARWRAPARTCARADPNAQRAGRARGEPRAHRRAVGQAHGGGHRRGHPAQVHRGARARAPWSDAPRGLVNEFAYCASPEARVGQPIGGGGRAARRPVDGRRVQGGGRRGVPARGGGEDGRRRLPGSASAT